MFSSVYQIAKNTFRESVREPIFLLLLLSALCLIGIFPVFTMFVFRQQIKMVVDSAMATTMVFGWTTAVLCASHAIAREIDNGTALLLLSKPVKRHSFILAKILGILAALTVFCFLSSLATVISIRIAKDQFRLDNTVMAVYFAAIALSFLIGGIHNYVNRSSFPMATVVSLLIVLPIAGIVIGFIPAGADNEAVEYVGDVVPALILILYSVWAMGTLATALSTRFNLVSNLVLCSVIFVVGLMSDYLLGRHAREVWEDTVPTGSKTLWISEYRFAPTEKTDVGRWSVPEAADPSNGFVVWSDRKSPEALPFLGTSPEKAWKDTSTWKNEVSDLEKPPVRLARYDTTTGNWEDIEIIGEAPPRGGSDAGADSSYVSYVFRRSGHRPRIPQGGTYLRPRPDPGSLIASALYACVPNWQLFWMADALAAKQHIPYAYVAYGGLYVILVIGFFMAVAVVLFRDREVGRQMVM